LAALQRVEALENRLEEAEELAEDLYDALRSEYVYCPTCTGHIGHHNDHHDALCVLLPIAAAKGHVLGAEQWDEETGRWIAARADEERPDAQSEG
jgi:hypothetical protein